MNSVLENNTIELLTRLSKRLFFAAGLTNPWATQLSSGRLDEAEEAMNSSLVSSPSLLEVKLWWIDLQLMRGGVPISALCSPLEESLNMLAECSDASGLSGQLTEGGAPIAHALGVRERKALGVFTALKVVVMLLEKGQMRLAVRFLRRVFDLAIQTHFLTLSEQVSLRDAVLEMIRLEMDKARIRQEKKGYLLELENDAERLVSFKPEEPEISINSTASAPEHVSGEVLGKLKRKPSLSSKTILESAKQQELEAERVNPLQSFSEQGTGAEVRAEERALPSAQIKRTMLLLATCCLLVVFYYVQQRLNERPAIEAVAPVGLFASQELIQPTLVLQEETPITQGQRALESVVGRIGQSVDRNKAGDTTGGEKTNTSDNKVTDGQVAKDDEVDRDALNAARDVADSQVKQSQDIVRFGEKEQESSSSGHIPYLDPNRLGQMKVEDMGSNPQRVDVGRLQISPDGRRFGPAPDSGGASKGVQAYAVEEMNPPKIFEILNKTTVLSAPSVVSVPVGDLNPGDKIEAVARMGPWLEIRSGRGNRGYIYFQDTVETGKGK